MKPILLACFGLIFIQTACTDSPISFFKKDSKKPIYRTESNSENQGGSEEQGGSNNNSTEGTNIPDEGPDSKGQNPSDHSNSPEGTNFSGPSLYNNVVWKRYRALENGMMRALNLSKQQLCNELEQFSCIDQIHLFNLGGNDPFVAAQGKRSNKPTILTPVAVERLAMHACTNRIELDKTAGPSDAEVFKGFTLNSEPIPTDKIAPLVSDLFRRILARDPSPEELAKLGEFAKQGMGSEQFAKTACFVVASLYENIFI
ncbi:MAG: hypothetical protein AB8G05_16680 [Oligoflexales bacterium]